MFLKLKHGKHYAYYAGSFDNRQVAFPEQIKVLQDKINAVSLSKKGFESINYIQRKLTGLGWEVVGFEK